MYLEIQAALLAVQDKQKAKTQRTFFKNSQTSIFLGVSAPVIRALTQQFATSPLPVIQQLMQSNVHDERTLAHKILCYQFKKADSEQKTLIYTFYLENKNNIRDWSGVDDSAPYIVGAYLLNKERDILYHLAKSNSLWDRRIAIVATWWFIRNNQFTDTLQIATLLLADKEDLIHKAVGWMLRELGKRDVVLLQEFLQKNSMLMPRTMLRYAIERLKKDERRSYLQKT